MNTSTSGLLAVPIQRQTAIHLFRSALNVSNSSDPSDAFLAGCSCSASQPRFHILAPSQLRRAGSEGVSTQPGMLVSFEIPHFSKPAFWDCSASVSGSTAPARRLTSKAYFEMLDQIKALRTDAELEDEDRPSEYALQLSTKVLAEAAAIVGMNFPAGTVGVGPNNSLRLGWRCAPREVRLVCGGTDHNRSYIYVEERPLHKVENAVSGENLAALFPWLTQPSK